MTGHEIQVIKDSASGLNYRLRCSCGFEPADDDELASHIAVTMIDGGAAPEIRPELRDALLTAARAWAHADRTADDRAAMIHRIERQFAKDGETADAKAHRNAASIALRAACQAEGDADEKLHELARLVLNDSEQTS